MARGHGSTKKLGAAWCDAMRRSGLWAATVDASPALAALASVKTRKELSLVGEAAKECKRRVEIIAELCAEYVRPAPFIIRGAHERVALAYCL